MRFFRSPSKCIKFVVISSVVIVITLQILGSTNYQTARISDQQQIVRLQTKDDGEREAPLNVSSSSQGAQPESPEKKVAPASASSGGGTAAASLETDTALAGERTHAVPNVTSITSNTSSSIQATEIIPSDNILDRIHDLNEEQSIRNEDLFGSVDNNSTLAVIVVQVHNRLQYLRQLIISFSQAKDIEKTLIIFSHDFWDPEVNELVASVDFAKTLQIFYPYSIQTHPSSFPGESPKDCPRNSKKEEAIKLKCTNAKWPDLYGHYREAKFTQTKHHWWWKANRIFNELKATKNFDGYVLFLEEDHYVAEDFLHVMTLLKQEREKNTNKGDILCLGTYLKHAKSGADNNYVEMTQWVSSKHNMGMAFDRSMWNKIHACTQNFCQFDDYNWDWSLYHLSLTCLPTKLQVMLVSGPRVFHIGECGVHHKKSECTTAKVVSKVKQILSKAKPFLFPKQLVPKVVAPPKVARKPPKGNGGWGDKRDVDMCLKLSQSNSTMQLQQQIDSGIM